MLCKFSEIEVRNVKIITLIWYVIELFSENYHADLVRNITILKWMCMLEVYRYIIYHTLALLTSRRSQGFAKGLNKVLSRLR